MPDRYKYFRIEARELLDGLNRAVLELEKERVHGELVNRILRLAHTLKGAARVVKRTETANLAHSIEDIFAAYRDQDEAVPQDRVDQTLGLLDAIAKDVGAIDSEGKEAPLKQVDAAQPDAEELPATVRVEIEEIDRLLEGMSESAVRVTALRQETEDIEDAEQLASALLEQLEIPERADTDIVVTNSRVAKSRVLAEQLRDRLRSLERGFRSRVDRVRSELFQAQEAAGRLRLLPASTIFAVMERAVRDAAHSLGKEVVFEPSGGDIRLDAFVLGRLRGALLHVVRNAVAHGIGSPAHRIALGKPAQGRVELRVERRGNRVAFVVRDDGRGINVEAVRAAALRKGVIRPEQAASLRPEDIVRIILSSGFTTSGTVDDISGRGIGLDVVRETAEWLKGEINVKTEPGRGTSVEICVPVSRSSVAALEVEAGGIISYVPLDSVRQVLRVAGEDIARSGPSESIVYEGKAVPFLALSGVLGMKISRRERRIWTVILLEVSSRSAAIGIDRLIGTGSVVVRPLPAVVDSDPVVLGASFDAEGNPQLILDPEGLVALAVRGDVPASAESPVKRAPVLVVDDSLTTRMLEQSILESAGYEVDVATSGEEGLAKARKREYGLILVDVEMPGIDGFEFVSRTQEDANLRGVPSILVTSRNAPEDLRRGKQVGARGYVVKGEFDQARLLQMIGDLTGGSDTA